MAYKSTKKVTTKKSPTPLMIKTLRSSMSITQMQAASFLYVSVSAWQRWELGKRKMHPALWEFFLIRTNNYTLEYIE